MIVSNVTPDIMLIEGGFRGVDRSNRMVTDADWHPVSVAAVLPHNRGGVTHILEHAAPYVDVLARAGDGYPVIGAMHHTRIRDIAVHAVDHFDKIMARPIGAIRVFAAVTRRVDQSKPRHVFEIDAELHILICGNLVERRVLDHDVFKNRWL